MSKTITEERAVCVFSGGPDSAVAAAIALEKGYSLYLVTFDYGQKTARKEIECSIALSKYFKCVEHKVVKIPFLKDIGGSGMTDDTEMLNKTNAFREYVPFRNSIFLSLAVAWAETLVAKTVYIGSIGGPWLTPDNSPQYFEAFQKVVDIGTQLRPSIKIVAPFAQTTKREVIARGLKTGVPLS